MNFLRLNNMLMLSYFPSPRSELLDSSSGCLTCFCCFFVCTNLTNRCERVILLFAQSRLVLIGERDSSSSGAVIDTRYQLIVSTATFIITTFREISRWIQSCQEKLNVNHRQGSFQSLRIFPTFFVRSSGSFRGKKSNR